MSGQETSACHDISPEVVLRQASELIAKHGWVQGRMRNGAGEMCIMGAIGMATNAMAGHPCPYVCSRALSTVQKVATHAPTVRFPDHIHGVAEHNDHCLHSSEEATKLLNDAANVAAGRLS